VHNRPVRRFATPLLAGVTAVVTAGALTSCSVGVEAGTLDPQRLSGENADVGLIKIRNALVVAPADDGDSSELVATIVNDGPEDDALVGVELAGPDGPVEVSLDDTSLELRSETATAIPESSDSPVTIDDIDLEPGTYVSATFSFETAGSATLRLLVLSSAAVYGGEFEE